MNKILTATTKQVMDSNVLVSFEDLTCPICLDIYNKPLTIKCGHIFCDACLKKCGGAEPACPLCRSAYDPSSISKAKDIQKKISSNKGACYGCQKVMSISKLRSHYNTCKNIERSSESPAPKIPPPEMPESEAPNRHTFSCPYCGLRNFDIHSLREHCNSYHGTSTARVVCPVCASMPWGNPNQISFDFIFHLNHRHRFEYDTFVDFNMDDDTALEQALAASQLDK